MDERELFYSEGVDAIIHNKSAKILVCGGGMRDKITFETLGFLDVTISNLDTRIQGDEFAPYVWKYENAESLSFDDCSFDYVVIHAAIHHASSPHKMLTEMYRVAKLGVLAFESRDSSIMRLLELFRGTYSYEHAAVYYNECQYGGMNNTDIPNYVYRWTEREIEKTIQSYAPYGQHKFTYRYGTAFPATPENENKGGLKSMLLKLARPLFSVFVKLFPKQQNLFAFYIDKNSIANALFPWLIRDTRHGKIIFNKEWGAGKYKNRAPTSD